MARRQEVPCRDAIGRARTAVVFPASFGRVAIQAPPGEVIVLTMAQLNELWLAAMAAGQPVYSEELGRFEPAAHGERGHRPPRTGRAPEGRVTPAW